MRQAKFIAMLLGLLLVVAGVSACSRLSKLGFSAKERDGAGAFSGVNAIQLSSDGKYILVWNPSTDSSEFTSTTYEIFMDSWDASRPVPEGTALAGNKKSSLPGSKIVELDGSNAPAESGALIASVKGVRSYTLSEPLEKGIDYMFQVRSINVDGKKDGNDRVLFYNLNSSFSFQGLLDENITVASDKSKISLRWNPATGNKANMKYVVYSDANFSQTLASTSQTSYDFLNPTIGSTYIFSVRAFDGKIADDNSGFVIVVVPDPRDKTPPVFAGVVSASAASDKRVTLKWAPSPSSDIAEYRVYFSNNLTSWIGSTQDSSFLVSGLVPGVSYSFVVRAVDASDNIDANRVIRTATTFAVPAPDFSGLQQVSAVSGTLGLTSLDLFWSQANSATGYKIYQRTVSGSFDFSSPLADIPSVASTTYRATGLNPGTEYFFVVRAYDTGFTPTRFELNGIEKSNTTLQIKAPTFAGIFTAAPGAGSLALTTVDVTWPSPSADGVFDGFVIQWNSPKNLDISGKQLVSSQIALG